MRWILSGRPAGRVGVELILDPGVCLSKKTVSFSRMLLH
jgi:hypothetical protein